MKNIKAFLLRWIKGELLGEAFVWSMLALCGLSLLSFLEVCILASLYDDPANIPVIFEYLDQLLQILAYACMGVFGLSAFACIGYAIMGVVLSIISFLFKEITFTRLENVHPIILHIAAIVIGLVVFLVWVV